MKFILSSQSDSETSFTSNSSQFKTFFNKDSSNQKSTTNINNQDSIVNELNNVVLSPSKAGNSSPKQPLTYAGSLPLNKSSSDLPKHAESNNDSSSSFKTIYPKILPTVPPPPGPSVSPPHNYDTPPPVAPRQQLPPPVPPKTNSIYPKLDHSTNSYISPKSPPPPPPPTYYDSAVNAQKKMILYCQLPINKLITLRIIIPSPIITITIIIIKQIRTSLIQKRVS